MKAIAKRYPVAAFAVLAYLISWVGWFALILKAHLTPGFEPMKSLPAFVLAASGPTIAGLILTGLTGGKAALRNMGHRLRQWRVGLRWYILALSITAGWFGVAALLYKVLGWTISDYATTLAATRFPGLSPWVVPLVIFVPYFFGGPLNEELGWRGFALPQLLRRHRPLTATLILGVVWATWHLPLFFMPGTGKRIASFPAYCLVVMGISFVLTLLHAKSGGGLLLPILFHNAANVTAEVMPMPLTDGVLIGLIWLTVGALVALEPRRWLESPTSTSGRVVARAR